MRRWSIIPASAVAPYVSCETIKIIEVYMFQTFAAQLLGDLLKVVAIYVSCETLSDIKIKKFMLFNRKGNYN